MNSIEYVYIDESGDPSLDTHKSGVSDYYVVCAILISGDNINACRKQAEDIRKRYFQNGEIKSSSVGKDSKRRSAILEDICLMPIKFAAIIVDKNEINKDSGLRFKRSFIKNIHGKLYKYIYKAFSRIEIVADKHGNEKFMNSFKQYIDDKNPNLFNNTDLQLQESSAVPLIQIADFLAGSLQRIYSNKDSVDLLSILTPVSIIMERWPPSHWSDDIIEGLPIQDQFDHIVSKQSIALALSYIIKHENDSEVDTKLKIETLRYLYYKNDTFQNDYTYTAEIINHLNSTAISDEKVDERHFRAIIASLRLDGVIIASSNKGYKLPNTSRDIEAYVSLVNNQVIPYLHRLAVARTLLKLSTNGKYEIISESNYPDLYHCIVALENSHLPNT